MVRINKSLRTFLSLVILLLVLINAEIVHAEKRQLKIGVVLPLTGPLAWVGAAMRRGIELAAKDSSLQNVTLEFQDDLSSIRTVAVTAFKALTGVSKVDGILNCSTSTLAAIAPVINQSKTPTLILWDSNRDMPRFSPYVIGFGYANEKAAEDAASFLVEKKQKRRIALISFQNDWSELLKQSFTAKVAALGGVLTLSETVADSNTDVRSIILRAKQKKTEALYLPLYGLGLISAIRQARELKFEGEILTVDSLGEQEMKETGPAANGVYVSQLFLPFDTLDEKSTLRSLGSATSAVDIGYTALGYDALSLLARELSSLDAGEPKQSVIKEIVGKTHRGELGNISINAEGIADRAIPIIQVQEQIFRPVP